MARMLTTIVHLFPFLVTQLASGSPSVRTECPCLTVVKNGEAWKSRFLDGTEDCQAFCEEQNYAERCVAFNYCVSSLSD